MFKLIRFFNPKDWKGMFGLAAKQLRNNKISFIGIWVTVFLVVVTSTICANLITSAILHPIYEVNDKGEKENIQLMMFTAFNTYILIMGFVILLSGVGFSIKRRWAMFANLRILGMQQTDLRRMICAEMLMMAFLSALIGLPVGGLLSSSTIKLFNHYNLTPDTFTFEFSIFPYLIVLAVILVVSLIVSFFSSKKLKNISIVHKTNPYALGSIKKIIIKCIFGAAFIIGPIVALLIFDYKVALKNPNHEGAAAVINAALMGPCIGVSLCGRYITYGMGHVFSKLFIKAPRISYAFSSLKDNASKLNPIFISLIITTLLTMFVFSANGLERDFFTKVANGPTADQSKSSAATMILITIILIFTVINIVNYVLLFMYDKDKSLKLRHKLGETKAAIFKSVLFEITLITLFTLIIGMLYPLLFTYQFSHNLLGVDTVIYNTTVFWIVIGGLIGISLISASAGYTFAIHKKTIRRRYLANIQK